MNKELAKLFIQVKPNASRNEITGLSEGTVHISVASPPVKDKANQELIKFLSYILGVPKSRIIINKGATSRRKVITILDYNQEQVTETILKQLNREQT